MRRLATSFGDLWLVGAGDLLVASALVDGGEDLPQTTWAYLQRHGLPRPEPAGEADVLPGVDGAAVEAMVRAGSLPRGVQVRVRRWGTDFQLAVWREIARIGPGETRTYADIAQAVGRPKAVQAVGNAVGANPCCLFLPCHRVVKRGNGPGGYAWGAERKESLLRYERRGLVA